jgi:hypothetical protein
LSGFELIEGSEAFGLRELPVEAHGAEAEVPQQQGDAQGVVAGGSEYYARLPFKFV